MLRRLSTTALVLLALLAGAARIHPVVTGLRGSYFDNTQWSGTPVVRRVDRAQTSTELTTGWPTSTPAAFSVAWSGSLIVLRAGTYDFALSSDDGSWLSIDGQPIIDNEGAHAEQTRTGSTLLARGTHAVRIQYVQLGGDRAFHWAWAPSGEPLTPVPTWATVDDRSSLSEALAAAAIDRGIAAMEWLLVALAWFAAAAWAYRAATRFVPRLVGDDAGLPLTLLLAASVALSVTGIWWGLPGGHWAPDEITPFDLWLGASQHFANGWGSRYPPLHYYVLTLVSSPVWLLERLGRLQPGGVMSDAVSSLAMRGVSTAASVGTLLFLHATAHRLVGRRAALFAVVQFALAAPFVYYSKTSNLELPYIFYASIALWAYVRIMDDPTGSDLLVFGLASAAAIGTKDQAYGLLLLPALLIVVALRRSHARANANLPTLRAVFDPRLLGAAAAALVALALIHNVVFNWAGFMRHLAESAGGASQGAYRLYPATVDGQLALFRLTLTLARVSWGWPLALAVVSGVGWMLAMRSTRRAAVLLLVPIVSYYLAFVSVIGFNYDRFVLPMMLPASIGGAFVLDRLSRDPRRRVGRVLVALAIAYSVAYAATVDVAMVFDSRYRAERLLAQQPGGGHPIGFVFPIDYYPRLDVAHATEMASLGQVQGSAPPFFVLNEDYAAFEPPDSERGVLIAAMRAGTAGYRRIEWLPGGFAFAWLPWPHPDLRLPRPPADQPVTSSLRHISPTYGIYRREP